MEIFKFYVFQNSERAVSVPASPLFIHGHNPMVTEKMLHSNRDSCPPPVQKAVTEGDKKLERTSVVAQLVTNKECIVKETETPSPMTTLPSVPQLPPSLPEPSVLVVRRQSCSNVSCFDFSLKVLSSLKFYIHIQSRVFTRLLAGCKNEKGEIIKLLNFLQNLRSK